MTRVQRAVNSLTDQQFACLALDSDDMYGDGIRLVGVRNPSKARVDMLDFFKTGQLPLTGMAPLRAAYNEAVKGYYNVKGEFCQIAKVNVIARNPKLF